MNPQVKKQFNYAIIITLFTFLTAATNAQSADLKLPEGFGLSAKFKGDRGIESHPSVLLKEDFEIENLDALKKRWENISNKDGKVLELIQDSPSGSGGKKALKMTATLNENTGGHLYKRLPREVETAYVRFYVKFPNPAAYIHHFVHFGGYNPSTPWPQGGAGERPRGDERITVGIEPTGFNGKIPPPGAWNFYCYWHEMKVSAGGRYWGNSLSPEKPLIIEPEKWQCVEAMLKLNSSPDEADGEIALWLDGKLVMHIKKGTPRTRWTGMGFKVLNEGGEPFEGFKWRNNNALKINFFWLLHYVTENAYRQNNVQNPPLKNTVIFDNIVVATEYIGPINGE